MISEGASGQSVGGEYEQIVAWLSIVIISSRPSPDCVAQLGPLSYTCGLKTHPRSLMWVNTLVLIKTTTLRALLYGSLSLLKRPTIELLSLTYLPYTRTIQRPRVKQ